MKALFFFFMIFTSLNSLAQQTIKVTDKVIDLGEVREIRGDGSKIVILKISADSPEQFKVKFNYKYRFDYEGLDNLFVTPSGNLSYSTHIVSSEPYENDNKLLFDIGDSTAKHGDVLELVLEISKPNKNSHWVKVDVSLKDAKGNTVSGGRKLMGLLGRSYKVRAGACD